MNKTVLEPANLKEEKIYPEKTKLKFVLDKSEKNYIVYGILGVVKSQIYIPAEYKGLPVSEIGGRAFFNLKEAREVFISNTIMSLCGNQFEGCTNLEKITVEEGNKEYRSENNCLIETETSTLILGCKNSIIPEGIAVIGSYAFKHCGGLTSLVIPSSVKLIRSGAFAGCFGIESIAVSHENEFFSSIDNCLIKKRGKSLILGCKNSKIPCNDSVTYIGDGAFSGCSELNMIKIPENITSIGVDAFYKCTALEEVIIPYSVRFICAGAFFGCIALSSIIYEGTIEEWNEIKKGKYWNTSTGEYVIHCTDGNIEKQCEKN